MANKSYALNLPIFFTKKSCNRVGVNIPQMSLTITLVSKQASDTRKSNICEREYQIFVTIPPVLSLFHSASRVHSKRSQKHIVARRVIIRPPSPNNTSSRYFENNFSPWDLALLHPFQNALNDEPNIANFRCIEPNW